MAVLIGGLIASILGAVGAGVSAGIGAGARNRSLVKAEAIDAMNRALMRKENRIQETAKQGAIDRHFRQGERAEAQQGAIGEGVAKEQASQKATGSVNRALQLVNSSSQLRQAMADRLGNKEALRSRI